jgi:hypothetical protein
VTSPHSGHSGIRYTEAETAQIAARFREAREVWAALITEAGHTLRAADDYNEALVVIGVRAAHLVAAGVPHDVADQEAFMTGLTIGVLAVGAAETAEAAGNASQRHAEPRTGDPTGERVPETGTEALRAKLRQHLAEATDPCQDRGAPWPCDVAEAVGATREHLTECATRIFPERNYACTCRDWNPEW